MNYSITGYFRISVERSSMININTKVTRDLCCPFTGRKQKHKS
jgi:hypothetical protein